MPVLRRKQGVPELDLSEELRQTGGVPLAQTSTPSGHRGAGGKAAAGAGALGLLLLKFKTLLFGLGKLSKVPAGTPGTSVSGLRMPALG